MSDVNSERARREARDSVANRPPREGENRVESAMRRYLGAEMFDEVHAPENTAAKPAKARRPRKPSEGTGGKG